MQPDGFHSGVVRGDHRCLHVLQDSRPQRTLPRLCALHPGGSETMRLQVYKKFTDPISKLSGRDLYEKIVRYKPQFLAFFAAANEPPPLVSNYAVRQRTAIVERISVFRRRGSRWRTPFDPPHPPSSRSCTWSACSEGQAHALHGPIPTKCLC